MTLTSGLSRHGDNNAVVHQRVLTASLSLHLSRDKLGDNGGWDRVAGSRNEKWFYQGT